MIEPLQRVRQLRSRHFHLIWLVVLTVLRALLLPIGQRYEARRFLQPRARPLNTRPFWILDIDHTGKIT